MHRGYVKIWRKIQDNWLWTEPRKFSKAEAWIDIIMEVQHSPEPSEVLIGNTVLTCNRGESLKSLDTWAKRWNWDKSATRRFFNLLEKSGNIDTQNERITTRIKVINYDTYCPLRNANETQVKRKRNASETQVTPDNNVNNVKNVKNTHKACAWPCDFSLTDEKKRYAVENGIHPEKVDLFWADFKDWACAKGATYKDWDAAFRMRVRKAPDYGKQFLGGNGDRAPFDIEREKQRLSTELAAKRLERFKNGL